MSRECKADKESLNRYIKDYNLTNTFQDKIFQEDLKDIHKKYFSLITWNAEMLTNIIRFKNDTNTPQRISESISDIGTSVFNWIHGNYKSAKIMLRSSIENFVRALAYEEDNRIAQSKNVYALFDDTKSLNIIKTDPNIIKLFNDLNSLYGLLCDDVHTKSSQNMGNISSLADYPNYNHIKSTEFKKVYIQVTQKILTILCILFKKDLHLMHHRNKENILISIQSKYKPIIHGVAS